MNRSEESISDTYPSIGCRNLVDAINNSQRCRFFSAVIQGSTSYANGAHAGSQHLHSGNQFFDPREHRFECSAVEGRIVRSVEDRGKPRLRFSQPQPASDALSASGRCCRKDKPFLHKDKRGIRWKLFVLSRSNHGPIWNPENQNSGE